MCSEWPDLSEIRRHPCEKVRSGTIANDGRTRQCKLMDGRLRRDVLELLGKLEETSMSIEAIRRQVETTFGEKDSKGRNRKRKE